MCRYLYHLLKSRTAFFLPRRPLHWDDPKGFCKAEGRLWLAISLPPDATKSPASEGRTAALATELTTEGSQPIERVEFCTRSHGSGRAAAAATPFIDPYDIVAFVPNRRRFPAQNPWYDQKGFCSSTQARRA